MDKQMDKRVALIVGAGSGISGAFGAGIHVVHFVIDGAVTRGNPEAGAPGAFTPQAIARSYMAVLDQPLGAWSWELELRSHTETF